jgi:carbon storage regulator
MLVLTRKQGDEIRIGKDIIVSVNWIDKDKVSIGITAPRSVEIVRAEILDDEVDLFAESNQ